MSDLQFSECIICDQPLYVYVLDERMDIDLTYCNNKDCARYKLVTLQEDV